MLPVEKKIKENNLFASEGLCIASTWGELFIFPPSFVVAWVEMPGWAPVLFLTACVGHGSAPDLLFSGGRGGPLLLKKLKNANRKDIMRKRRHVVKFLTCSTTSGSWGADRELKGILLLAPWQLNSADLGSEVVVSLSSE